MPMSNAFVFRRSKVKLDHRHLVNLGLTLLVGLVMLRFGWVGYVGSDDHSYARGALAWLSQFPHPYIGDDHWTLRHPVVVPIALSLALFGHKELSLGLPSALFFLLFLVTNYLYVQRFFGASIAMLSAAMLATTPLFAVQATFPQDVIIQVLAVSTSFWLFYSATQSLTRAWLLFAAGSAAALGWLTLETTAGLILFYSILFLWGFGVPRRYYWIMAVAFLLIVGVEVGYFAALTGDPLYRYRIDLHHDVIDRGGDVALASRLGSFFDIEGNLSVNVLLQPVVALLLNQEFGLLFWLIVPASIWIWRCKDRISAEDRRLLLLLGGLGIVWLLFVSLNAAVLWIIPRYYSVATWAAVIIVAYSVGCLSTRQSKVAMFVCGAWLFSNLFCVYVENKNPLFTERALVDYVARHPGRVYTDPMTLTRAKLLLEFHGVAERVSSQPSDRGALVYVNWKNIERCKRLGKSCRWDPGRYLPGNNWIELERIQPRSKLSGVLLTAFRLDGIIPVEIADRLAGRSTGATLYRTGRNGA
jgi:4-amino-4-deoxy-L-arabinose transferase-like glycosyltransferase